MDLPTLLGIVQALQGALRFAWIVGNQNCAETYPNHRRSRVGRSLCPSNCCCSPRLESTFDVRKIWDCHLIGWQRKMVSDCSLGCFSSRQWPAQKETRRQSKSHSLFLWCRHSPWTKWNILNFFVSIISGTLACMAAKRWTSPRAHSKRQSLCSSWRSHGRCRTPRMFQTSSRNFHALPSLRRCPSHPGMSGTW